MTLLPIQPGLTPAGAPAPVPPAMDAGKPTIAPPDDAGVEERWESLCVGGAVKPLGAIKLTRSVDYVALYSSVPETYPGPQPARTMRYDATGRECATSSDLNCMVQLNMLTKPNDSCKTMRACGPFVITTQGDEVRRIDDKAGLMELLGTIDSPAKAAVAAFWEGLRLACPSTVMRPQMMSVQLRGTDVMRVEDGWLLRSEWQDCGPYARDTLRIDEKGNVIERTHEDLGHNGCAVGRRPAGLLAGRPESVLTPLGSHLANIARLEAASVFAFERLAGELAALRAPEALIASARAAAGDEVRHAARMTALARSYGAEPAEPCVLPTGARSAFDIALENAVEGCVRETYGALIAHCQAALASDPVIATTMTAIAEDETRHAELSWRVAGWLEPQLTDAERLQLRAARGAALAQLADELELEGLSGDENAALGWPSREVADGMRRALGAQLDV